MSASAPVSGAQVTGLPSKVLVGIDGSDFSRHAGEYAIELCAVTGASLSALHVTILPPYAPEAAANRIREEATERIDGILSSLVHEAEARGVEFTTLMRDEHHSLVRAIVDVAREKGVQLIVLGTGGLTGLPKTTLGSVAAGVVVRAPCPVLAVR